MHVLVSRNQHIEKSENLYSAQIVGNSFSLFVGSEKASKQKSILFCILNFHIKCAYVSELYIILQPFPTFYHCDNT